MKFELGNRSYIFLMLFFFTACVSKKSTVEYRNRVVTDTVIVKKNVEIIKSIRDTLIVEEPCDSLGNLTNFNQVLKTPKTTIKLKSDKGKIVVDYEQDSIITSDIVVKDIKREKDVQIIEKKTVKYRVNWRVWLALIISVALNLFLLKDKIRSILPF
jgi:methyl coenzyme M reductase beta subunit